MSRSYTNGARPAQTTRPTPRMNPPRGTSEESPMDVSPTRSREPVRAAEGYTMFTPDETKRQAIQRQADEETRKHEEYKKSNQQHYSHVGTVGGGSAVETGANDVTQRKLPSPRSNLTPMQKMQKYRDEKKQREEKENEEKKQKQRQIANENEKRQKDRQRNLEADHKRANAAWLDKVEGKSSEKTKERPAAAVSASAVATDGNTETESHEFRAAMATLASTFPEVSRDILKSLLKETGNDVDRVAQFLS